MRVTLTLFSILLLSGCSQTHTVKRNALESEMFGPALVQFHSFTQIKDWTGDNNPDGLEALVEFDDQFGDPTKAAGTLIFELYEYRRADPDPRGQRLRYWQASIISLEEQKLRWNRISRTYTFQLAFPEVQQTHSYVLTAQFQSSSGERLWARTVLAAPEEDKNASTQPTSQPTKRSPQP